MANDGFDHHVRVFRALKRAIDRAEREAEARSAEKVRRWLSQGGQKAIRSGPTAEVFTRHGEKRDRESPAGERTRVSNLLSPKLLLTQRQRATGNCYGAFFEMSATSGKTEFIREFVDRSVTGTGGATERQVHMLRMVSVAREAMKFAPAIVYPLGKTRGNKAVGEHQPVKALALLDAVCVHGFSLEAIAVDRGWLAERRDGKNRGQMVVPDRQRKHLAEALRVVLDGVFDAWDAKGMSIPWEFMQVEVE